jgi:hypothetical protein
MWRKISLRRKYLGNKVAFMARSMGPLENIPTIKKLPITLNATAAQTSLSVASLNEDILGMSHVETIKTAHTTAVIQP